MINGFAIILNEEILYCSDDKKYPLFETILFIEKLTKSINPLNIWRLNSILFSNDINSSERIIIKHEIRDNNNIFYCISSSFKINSEISSKIINKFYSKIESSYSSFQALRKASKSPMFQDIIELASDDIKIKYDNSVQSDYIKYNMRKSNKKIDEKPKILYCGISSQGLPIISKLYAPKFFSDLKDNDTIENIEVFSSKLSAKLATIAMNTIIRAETNIREIIINDLRKENNKIIILYSNINGFSLDFVATGNIENIFNLFYKLKTKISKEPILNKEFKGDLKPYRNLNNNLDRLIKDLGK